MDLHANLQPYGDTRATVTAPQADDVLQRAAWKLHRARTVGQKAAGGNWRFMGKAIGLGLVFVLLLSLMALVISDNKDAGFWPLLPLAGIVGVVALVVWSFLRTRPVTPQAALAEFIRTVASGKFARARALVVDGDLDHMPRYHPVFEALGRPDQVPRPYSNALAFADYWRLLIKPDSLD